MNLLEEVTPEVAGFITKRMLKDVRKYKATQPYHAARRCKSKRCVWHQRGR